MCSNSKLLYSRLELINIFELADALKEGERVCYIVDSYDLRVHVGVLYRSKINVHVGQSINLHAVIRRRE